MLSEWMRFSEFKVQEFWVGRIGLKINGDKTKSLILPDREPLLLNVAYALVGVW